MTWHYDWPSVARTTHISNKLHGPKDVYAIEVRLYCTDQPDRDWSVQAEEIVWPPLQQSALFTQSDQK